MKMLIGLLTLTMSLGSIASSGETKTFVYDGSQNSVELLLKGEKTHTEYRYEQRRSICYRTTVIGYRTVCTASLDAKLNPPPRPRPIPRPIPRPAPRHCYQQPIYGQVAYSCMQTVTIPYEVKDYDVDARVIVDVTKLAPEVASVETFRVSLKGDELSLSVQGSKKFFALLKKKDIRPSMNGSVKFLDGLYAVELVESAPVLAALDMSDLSYENGVLTFGLGPVSSKKYVSFGLNVTKRPILGSNTVLFDRELAPSELDIVSTRNGSEGQVSMNKIGVRLTGGRYGLTPSVKFKGEGVLLNREDFGDLEVSRTLLLKL